MAKEMKMLGGYEIVDQKAREYIEILQNKEDYTKELEEKVDEALSLAKGATRAFVYDTYEDMISDLNVLSTEELNVNYHIMIRTVCVPDLWVSGVSDERVEYTYTSNEDFIVDLTEDGVVQVGHFVLSALETQKVDLSDYVKKTDYASSLKAGVVKASVEYGIDVMKDGGMFIVSASKDEINNRKYNPNNLWGYHPIVLESLDYAVKKALSDCKLTGDDVWTEEEKSKALKLLGGVPKVTSKGAYNRVYVIDVNGNQTVYTLTKSANNIANNNIAQYSYEGNLFCNEPLSEKATANKKYVDDLVGSVESILTELHTHAESLIGGEV